MSDNNQLAINPYVAGGIGAVVGGAAGQWMPGLNSIRPIKEEYNSAQNLLTLEADKFEALKPAEDAAQEIRDNYDTFVKGRKEIADAQAGHDKEVLDGLNKQFESDAELSESNFKYGEGDSKQTLAEIQTEIDSKRTAAMAKDEVKNAVNDDQGVKDAQKALDDLYKKDADGKPTAELADGKKAEDVTAAQKKLAEAKDKVIKEKDAEFKTATEKLEKAKADRLTKMKEKIATMAEGKKDDDPIAKLAKKIKDGFDPKKKAKDMVDAKDSKYAGAFDKVKGILKRTTWKAAAGLAVAGAAIGAAIAYIVGPKNDVPSDVA